MTDEVQLVCYLAVLRALDLAARRRRNTGRNTRQAVEGIPNYLTHTQIDMAGSPGACDRLLEDAWFLLDTTLADHQVVNRTALVETCDAYARNLIVHQLTPTPRDLRACLVAVHHATAS